MTWHWHNFYTLVVGIILFSLCTVVLHSIQLLFVAFGLIGFTLVVFYGFRLLVKHAVWALFVTLLLFIGLSLIPSNVQWGLTCFIFIGAGICCGVAHRQFRGLLVKDWHRWTVLNTVECFVWICLPLLFLPIGITDLHGLWTHEFHPIYELSVGHSCAQSIWDAPDLSYSGKMLRMHFLSVQIPHLFSNIFQISILKSAYFLVPVWSFLLICILLQILFTQFSAFRVPTIYLFFMPVVGAGFWAISNVFTMTLFAPISYALGFLLIGMGLYFLMTENITGLVLCSSVLILTKASFFLVIFGGIVLYFARTFQFKKGLSVLAFLVPVFIGLYFLFLSGAHTHNHWIVFPTILYFWFFQYGFSFSGILFAFFPTIALILTVWFYLKKGQDRRWVALAAVSLSGMLGALLLTEASESNSMQFIYAAFLPTVFVVWHGFFTFLSRYQISRSVGYALIGICCGLGVVSNLRTPTDVLQGYWGGNESSPSLSADLISAYTWMHNNIGQKQTVLIGKHYESDQSGMMWWPNTGFARSALSGKQFYCENFKYKGIAMEADFPVRFANAVHFYKNFVHNNQVSRNLLDGFYEAEFGKEPGNPFSAPPRWTVNTYTKWRRKLFFYLSFGKEWSWINRPEQVFYEVNQHLGNFKATHDWLTSFMIKENIGYVVLEKGDHPKDLLKSLTETVYANRSITVLKVDKSRLVRINTSGKS